MKWISLGLFLAVAAVAGDDVEITTPLQNCNVRTGPYHPTSNFKCFGSEVMVGIQSQNPQVLLCARLEVSCPNEIVSAEAEKKKLSKRPKQAIESDRNAG